MSKQIKLVIPQMPLSINETRVMHWAKLRKVKKLWVDEVWMAIVNSKIRFTLTKFEPYKKAKIAIKIFFRTDAKRDADNYPCKEVIDAIKNNGLIEDDDYDHIGKVDVDITDRDREHPRTEITIEEVKL